MTVKNLDYLGLVAGLVDDLGMVQKINESVGEQPGEIISPNLVVKAIIINFCLPSKNRSQLAYLT